MLSRRRRPLRRLFFVWLVVYVVIIAGGAYALWRLIPAEVKKAVYETYVNPP